jgi:hypothetical protein
MAYLTEAVYDAPHSTEVEIVEVSQQSYGEVYLIRRKDGEMFTGDNDGKFMLASVAAFRVSENLPRPVGAIDAAQKAVSARQSELKESADRRIAALKAEIATEQKAEHNRLSAEAQALYRERAWAEQRAIVGHPHEGKKVYKTVAAGRMGRRTEIVFGLIETRRAGTDLPANRGNWSLPNMGTSFVRLLKKDGKPGLNVETAFGGDPLHENAGWKLVEEV